MKRVFFCFLATLLVSACKEKLKEPENLDFIYVDLLKQLSEAKNRVAANKAEVKNAKKEWEDVLPQTGFEKIKRAAYFKAIKKLRFSEQRQKFLEIRLESRKEWARESYDTAWEKKQPWPDKENFKAYEINKRLQSASRNWGERVPKLQDRIRSLSSSDGDGEKSDSSSSGGGH